jgi:hypothetical protein
MMTMGASRTAIPDDIADNDIELLIEVRII